MVGLVLHRRCSGDEMRPGNLTEVQLYWQLCHGMLSRQLIQTSSFFIKKTPFGGSGLWGKWEREIARNISKAALQDVYRTTKEICSSKKPPRDVNPKGVFACNELNLAEISVYGFDYDYTLACYKPSMDQLLYNLGKEVLVNKYMYPKAIQDLDYRPDFTIRGLHYDIEKGLFMKLDSFLQIQLGTVYRGLTPIPDEDVIQLYKNKVVPIAYVEAKEKFGAGSSKLYQLADLFSRPEMGLLCNITEYFEQNRIDYHPEILFRDVRYRDFGECQRAEEMACDTYGVKYIDRDKRITIAIQVEDMVSFVKLKSCQSLSSALTLCSVLTYKTAIGSIHPVMHQEVMQNTEKYLEANPDIRELLARLKKAEKKLFLITNSPFRFVNKGLNLIIGEDWMEFFDVIIVEARKPKFFTDESRPIRVYDRNLNSQLWDRVTRLEKGTIYYEGTIRQLQDMTGWTGDEVLYFGDHPYSDLADATLEHGWRTGAIIHELTHEIEALNNPDFKMNSNWLQMLTQLIEEYEDLSEKHKCDDVIKVWDEERNQLLQRTKNIFNPQFGSVFRTYNNPSYFSRRLFRFADIYTSCLTNLLKYSINHKFFPRRGALPHEYASLFM